MSEAEDARVAQEQMMLNMADVHICGMCRAQFTDIALFVEHKKQHAAAIIQQHRAQMVAAETVAPPGEQVEAATNRTAEPPRAGEGSVQPEQPMADSGSEVNQREREQQSVSTGASQPPAGMAHVLENPSCITMAVPAGTAAPTVVRPLVTVAPDQQAPATASVQQQDQRPLVNVSGERGSVEVHVWPMKNEDGLQQVCTTTTTIAAGAIGPSTEVGGPKVSILRKPILSPESSAAQSMQRSAQLTMAPNKSPTKVYTAASPVKRYQCMVEGCNFSTAYQKDLGRHHLVHTGVKPFTCHTCNKSFSRNDKLKAHIRTHAGVKPHKCEYCTYAALDRSSLKKHLRVHTDERPFKCQICSYASRNSSQLVIHLRTHTGDSPFVCRVCSASFKINSDLKRHERLHSGEKPYNCPECDYCCAIKGNLTTHMRINHSPDNQMKCTHCEFSTSSKKVYREHQKKHAGVNTQTCPHCSYVCTNRAAWRNHQRIHSDLRPYRCYFCTFSSKQAGNVRSHMQRKHPQRWNAKKGKPVTKSEELPAVDKRSTSLRPSCRKEFSCFKCDAQFVRADSLRCHMRCHKAQEQNDTALAVLELSQSRVDPSHVASIKEEVDQQQSHNEASTGILQAALAQSDILPPQPMDVGKASDPAPSSKASNTFNQTTKNLLLAIMQNNQNIAVEDNMQNLAISMINRRVGDNREAGRDRHHSAPDMRSLVNMEATATMREQQKVAEEGSSTGSSIGVQPLYLVENETQRHQEQQQRGEQEVRMMPTAGDQQGQPMSVSQASHVYTTQNIEQPSGSAMPLQVQVLQDAQYAATPQVSTSGVTMPQQTVQVIIPSSIMDSTMTPPSGATFVTPPGASQQHVVLRMPITQASNLLQAMQLQPANQQSASNLLDAMQLQPANQQSAYIAQTKPESTNEDTVYTVQMPHEGMPVKYDIKTSESSSPVSGNEPMNLTAPPGQMGAPLVSSAPTTYAMSTPVQMVLPQGSGVSSTVTLASQVSTPLTVTTQNDGQLQHVQRHRLDSEAAKP